MVFVQTPVLLAGHGRDYQRKAIYQIFTFVPVVKKIFSVFGPSIRHLRDWKNRYTAPGHPTTEARVGTLRFVRSGTTGSSTSYREAPEPRVAVLTKCLTWKNIGPDLPFRWWLPTGICFILASSPTWKNFPLWKVSTSSKESMKTMRTKNPFSLILMKSSLNQLVYESPHGSYKIG